MKEKIKDGDLYNLLVKQFNHVLNNSKYYQKILGNQSAMGLIEEFEEIPFTTKSDILNDQQNTPPFGLNLSVSTEDIVRVHKTSGTTNKPVLIALTSSDVQHILQVGSKCFQASGVKKDDIVMHCLNYNMWAGGYTDHQNLEESGACVVPFGVGHTKSLIEMIQSLKATAIHCTPSYLSIIDNVLQADFGLVPRDLRLRLALLGAEPGLQNEPFRKSIENRWGFKAMNANYGMSEVLSIIASECTYQQGLHFRASDKLLVELIDPHTGACISLEKGAEGEMVFTNLCKQAQPLIRYRSGDIVRITHMHCACGSSEPIFEIIGRSDDMLVIRGLNVFASSIEDIIRSHNTNISCDYRILVSKNNPITRVQIQIEGEEGGPNICTDIIEHCRKQLGIRVEAEHVQVGIFPRNEGKTTRVLRTL